MNDDVLSRLAGEPSAAVLLGAVPAILGVDVDTAVARVGELLDSGDLVLWREHEGGPAVCLSPQAAARLGLELVDRYGVERWTSKANPLPERSRSASDQARNASDVWPLDRPGLDGRADPKALHPAEVLEPTQPRPKRDPWTGKVVGEAVERFPLRLLGLNQPWPGRCDPGKPCFVCGGKPLRQADYCLSCDRSWRDRTSGTTAPTGPKLP